MTSDMAPVIIPKSDQQNADDFLAGPRTITITSVSIRPGTEQPVSIHFDGDDNKPYKPCKGMCRVLVALWGPDAKEYTGRSMTLYRDPKVKWAGLEVGGIRISHMSHIERDHVMALTESKQSRKPFAVKPLVTRSTENSSHKTTPRETQESAKREWTKAEVDKRGAEIAAILRDHGGSAANLSWCWQQNESEIQSMPVPAQRGLRKVYETEMAAIERAVADEAADAEGRVEDERAGELGV